MAGDVVAGCTCERLAARVKDLEADLLAAQSALAERGEALRQSQEAPLLRCSPAQAGAAARLQAHGGIASPWGSFCRRGSSQIETLHHRRRAPEGCLVRVVLSRVTESASALGRPSPPFSD